MFSHAKMADANIIEQQCILYLKTRQAKKMSFST